jgi:hypothetical protein
MIPPPRVNSKSVRLASVLSGYENPPSLVMVKCRKAVR